MALGHDQQSGPIRSGEICNILRTFNSRSRHVQESLLQSSCHCTPRAALVRKGYTLINFNSTCSAPRPTICGNALLHLLSFATATGTAPRLGPSVARAYRLDRFAGGRLIDENGRGAQPNLH